MNAVVLDTDVSSRIIKDTLPDPMATKLVGRRPAITFVTLGELTQWVELLHWAPARRAKLANWLDRWPVLPYDEDVATTWGRLSAAARQRGRPRPQNDMWIAACCLTYGLPLATLNVKDFADFREHGLVLLGSS